MLPGRFNHCTFNPGHKAIRHPCPRSIMHVRWLVQWYVAGPVLDPFMGSGTTLLAAQEAGWPAVGIELEEKYCREAVRRLRQRALPLRVEDDGLSQRMLFAEAGHEGRKA